MQTRKNKHPGKAKNDGRTAGEIRNTLMQASRQAVVKVLRDAPGYGLVEHVYDAEL